MSAIAANFDTLMVTRMLTIKPASQYEALSCIIPEYFPVIAPSCKLYAYGCAWPRPGYQWSALH